MDQIAAAGDDAGVASVQYFEIQQLQAARDGALLVGGRLPGIEVVAAVNA